MSKPEILSRDDMRARFAKLARRIAEHPAPLNHQERLDRLCGAIDGLCDVFGDLSRTAPEKAPELWLDRIDKSELVFDFIRRVYNEWIERGFSKRDLRKLDYPLYHAIFEWDRKHKGKADLVLLTHRQDNDRLLAQLGGQTLHHITHSLPQILSDRLKLYRTVSARRYQRKPDGT